MLVLVEAVANFVALYLCVLLIRVIWSWFPQVDERNPAIAVLHQLTDPYLNGVRAIIPPIAGMDLSASIGILILAILQNGLDRLVFGMASSF